MHVVQQAEHRGSRVGAGVLGALRWAVAAPGRRFGERLRPRRPVRVAVMARPAPDASRALPGHPGRRLVAATAGRPVVEVAAELRHTGEGEDGTVEARSRIPRHVWAISESQIISAMLALSLTERQAASRRCLMAQRRSQGVHYHRWSMAPLAALGRGLSRRPVSRT